MTINFKIFLVLLLALFASCETARADQYTEDRYLPDGVEIARNADGSIKRSAKVVAEFQKIHPCPSTGLTTESCPGWWRDHVVPLACRGKDSVSNLQWLDTTTKGLKDLFERFIYSNNGFASKGCYPKLIPGK